MAVALIAVSLMLVLALIPAEIHSAQRAENVQAAAAWSRQLLENAPVPEEFPIPPEIAKTEHQAKIGSTNFTAVRTLSTIPGESYLYKIEVETNWDDAVEPVRLSLTKYDPAGPEP